MPEQFAHVAPPEPHAAFAKPPAHVVSLEQQPAQFAGPHFAAHTCASHAWFVAVQSVHARPALPHVVSCTPVTQVLPEQQPAQFAGLHTGAAHAPAWQTCAAAAQFVQAAPPLPHDVSCVPAAQTSPTQQPPGHVAALQPAGGMQTPALQLSFAPHTVHAAPPLPHSARVVAITQALPAQQPAQFAGLHAGGAWHVRAFACPSGSQILPVALQFAHAAPFVPHALASVPTTHVVPLQQPAQLPGPHAAVPWHCPPVPDGPQAWPVAVQLTHAPPLFPHDVLSRPGRHWSPTQQPVQFVASHLVVLHARVAPSHVRPSCEQSVQVAPLLPHAVASLPARQVATPLSKLQHPLGHSSGPQFALGRSQTRPFVTSQVVKPFAMQSEHARPADPHACVSEPTRQMPLLSQHPFGQLVGPHVPPSPPVLASNVSSSRLERPHPGARTTKKSDAKNASANARRSKDRRMQWPFTDERSGTRTTPANRRA